LSLDRALSLALPELLTANDFLNELDKLKTGGR